MSRKLCEKKYAAPSPTPPYETGETELQELFARRGDVEKVNVMPRHGDRPGRGLGVAR